MRNTSSNTPESDEQSSLQHFSELIRANRLEDAARFLSTSPIRGRVLIVSGRRLGKTEMMRVRLKLLLEKYQTSINGRDVDVWVHKNDKPARFTGAKTCDFLRNPDDGPFAGKFICGIHTFKPFHCWAPHFVVRKRNEGTGFIARMQFGRNHQFGCPVVFEQSMRYFDKDYQQDIDKLKWMRDIADDMKVKTWIPQMIHWMENSRGVIEEMIQRGSLQLVDISSLYLNQDDPVMVSDSMFM